MKLRLIKLRDSLADSFWFLPALLALLATAAALGLVALDRIVGGSWVRNIGWVWSGGADGARAVLSVIAGSVMTVVSIVFSLTITTLAQTSSHYGPRVLRNFTSDRGVQFTLGIFIATFVYCLLVLRTVRSAEESGFVPYLSVNIGVLLALASLAVLIFFIHHVSQNIQAENLIADIGQDFQRMLPTFFPERVDESSDAEQAPPDENYWQHAHQLTSKEHGYLERVDDEALMRMATQHDLQLKLEKRPGEFVSRGTLLALTLPASRISDAIEEALRGCFSLGTHRTPHQDALYPIQQLVEIAAHALSPGINEPFTALTCIDWLGGSLRGVVRRDLPFPVRYDQNGQLRVVARSLKFEEMVRAALDQIRIYGASNPDIMVSLLDTLAGLAADLRRTSDREVLRYHVKLIGTDAEQIKNGTDRERVAKHLQRALRALTPF